MPSTYSQATAVRVGSSSIATSAVVYAIPVLPAITSQCTQPDPWHREELLLAHLPQVRMVARGLWKRQCFAVDLDDLIGYGTLGLLDAIGKYDPSRGILLKTYAEHRIRGAILDGLRGMDWLSRSARKKVKSLRDSAPTQDSDPIHELANTGLADPQPSTPQYAMKLAAHPTKLPIPTVSVFSAGGLNEVERLYHNSRAVKYSYRSEATPEHLTARKQQGTLLAMAIADLSERHRQVLDLYYRREMSMRQIADLLGVHESRVSQLHLAAITRLRKTLTNPTAGAGPSSEKALKYREADPRFTVHRLTAMAG